MQGALSEPCLFHATLYAGSSHFDHLEKKSQSWITLYHQNEAIRLLNERLSDMTSAADDRTILAVIPLAMFAVSRIPSYITYLMSVEYTWRPRPSRYPSGRASAIGRHKRRA